jgi:hypothetical protein
MFVGETPQLEETMAANPIQIVPLRTQVAAPVTTPNLTYRGGPLLGSVQVFTFFWGAAWQQDPPAGLMRQVNQFFDYVVSSPLVDQLAEYSIPSTAIGHGTTVGTVTVTNPAPAGASISDSDVQQLIQQEIANDPAVAKSTPNSLYYVYLPAGVSVTKGGGASCSAFCGYHDAIGGQLFYAVMPYPDCSGCHGGLSALDALTSTSSHELCEAITDPVPGQGWYDDSNGEIGDICSWQTKQLGVYTVQLEWSNSAGRCM